MGGNMKTDPEIERLVKEVKDEMINEGLIYTPPAGDKRYKTYSRYGKKIVPEWGFILSKMIGPPKPKNEKEQLDDGIQFRGKPQIQNNRVYRMLMRYNKGFKPILKEKK